MTFEPDPDIIKFRVLTQLSSTLRFPSLFTLILIEKNPNIKTRNLRGVTIQPVRFDVILIANQAFINPQLIDARKS